MPAEIRPQRAVGVIVARFQVPDLHQGHRYTIEYVLQQHEQALIILGATPVLTDRNPLSFEMRKQMIEQAYPGARITIVESASSPASHMERSRMIDALIEKTFPGRNAMLYGARDSFVHTYRGIFPTQEVPTVYAGSATQVRKSIQVAHTSDFRAGVIYGIMNRGSFGRPAVDVVIAGPNARRVILVGKHQEEGKLRFPGVFFDPTVDQSYEAAGQRCMAKELPKVRFRTLRMVGSCRIDDWRYRKTGESVISLVLKGFHVDGSPAPGQGVDSAHWIDVAELDDVLIESHKPLAAMLKNHWL